MHRPVRPMLVLTAVACTAGVAIATLPTAAGPAGAATARVEPTSDFTAGVRSIDHAAGLVVLVGTGPTGGSVSVTAEGIDPVWTESHDGRWEASVRLSPGPHVLRVTSQVSGQVVDVPVEVLGLLPPTWVPTIDPFARTITLDGAGVDRPARYEITDDGRPAGVVEVASGGRWHAVLRDRAFGEHDIVVTRILDGTENGVGRDTYDLDGSADVTTASASLETERITLAGRAPVGTTLRFADASGPVDGPDGHPLEVTTPADTEWSVELPIPGRTRLHPVSVTTFDGHDQVGATRALVVVPITVSATVEELRGGALRLTGVGEPGGTVDLEHEDGRPVLDDDDQPVRAEIGESWEIVVPRETLPAEAVLVRQRVRDVAQGAVRLVLPPLPVTPGPGPDDGEGGDGDGAPGSEASGPGIVTGTHPSGARAAGAEIRTTPSVGHLASTGTEPAGPLAAAAGLLAAGAVLLGVGRSSGRRGRRRD